MGLADDTLDIINNLAKPDQAAPGQPAPGQPQAAPAQPKGLADETLDIINNVQSGAPPAEPTAPKQQPSIWANIGTGAARGLGSLLEGAGYAGLADQNLPLDIMPKPGEMEKTAVNWMTGGNPYQPQTAAGRVLQNTVAGTVAGAPMAAIGPGGLPALGVRELMNLTGNIGGELGREATPSHPILGPLIGSTVGSLAAPGLLSLLSGAKNQIGRMFGTEGAVNREAMDQFASQPGYNITMPQVDDFLTQNGGSYWTPARIAAAPDYQKRQVVQNMIPPSASAAAPSTSSNLKGYLIAQALGGGVGGGLAYGAAHYLGIPHGATELIGTMLGDLGGVMAKPLLENRGRAFSQGVADTLKNNQSGLWQQYQAQQAQPSLWQRLMMGVAAPEAATQIAP